MEGGKYLDEKREQLVGNSEQRENRDKFLELI